MKNLFLILLSISSLTFGQTTEKPEKNLVFQDKEFLLNYYQQTMDNLQNSISGLSEAQMQFQASDSTWSISQCVEHIILTENMIFEMLKTNMEQPANPERRKDIVNSDEDIIAMVTNRTEKYKAPEMLQTKGKYNDPKTALKDLKNQRKEILKFIQNADIDNLRNHINDSPAGATDAYQSLLFLAGHTARHTLQIHEVKAEKSFPKK